MYYARTVSYTHLDVYKRQMIQYETVVGLAITHGESSDRYFMAMSRLNSANDAWADNEFIFQTNGVGKSDGGWTTPADFAEYFYSNDANLQKGDIVTLTGENLSLIHIL